MSEPTRPRRTATAHTRREESRESAAPEAPSASLVPLAGLALGTARVAAPAPASSPVAHPAPATSSIAALRRAHDARTPGSGEGKQSLSVPQLPSQAPALPSSPLPADLRADAEARSGISLGDVRVHRNSPRPAQFGAHAYAMGDEIHLGPGSPDALSHEAWHIVQQRIGQVRATTTKGTIAINDDPALEHSADHHDLATDGHRTVGSAAPVMQLLKAELALPKRGDGATVGSMRALIAQAEGQVTEYAAENNYPDTVVTEGSRNQMTALVVTARQALEQLIRTTGWGEASGISGGQAAAFGAGVEHLNQFAGALKKLIDKVNEHYNSWVAWRALNPEHVADLADLRAGTQLGYDDESAYRYGSYDGGEIFVSLNGSRPVPAAKDKAATYRKLLRQETHSEELLGEIAEMDMDAPAGAITGELANSPSQGAKAMRKVLTGAGDITFVRVMSEGEAEAVLEGGGGMVRKEAAAKWITMGKSANINSSGDRAHSHTMEWTVDGNLRKALLKPGMNYYNENSDQAATYKEPYWVWKDAEDANIAFSPVVVAVFNSMIKAKKYNGKAF